jgi:glucose-1-phosphate thymidylyltransferase
LIVSGRGHAGHFLELLGSGANLGVNFTYEIQDEAGGIAQALSLAEDFADDEPVTVILGDNVFEGSIREAVESFNGGAKIFLKEVEYAKRFGVAEIDGDKIVSIEEKPEKPKSNYAVTGLYIYDSHVFDIIKQLKPSHRGELEITDVNNAYISNGEMEYSIVDGYWTDAGTMESLFRANQLVRESRMGK